MTPFPAAVIPRTLGTIYGRHVACHQMFLQTACIRESGAAGELSPVSLRYPPADEYLGIGDIFRTGQDGRGTPFQRGWRLARTQLRAHAGPRMAGVRRVG